jgi:transcriptional regulator with XRE-family HTH domain
MAGDDTGKALYRQIGKAISEVREKKHLTRAQVAEQTTLSVHTLALIEKGKGGLSTKTLEQFCARLGVPVTYIFILACESDEDEIQTPLNVLKGIIRRKLGEPALTVQAPVPSDKRAVPLGMGTL